MKINKLTIFLIMFLVLLVFSQGFLLTQNIIFPTGVQRQEFFPNIDLVSKDELSGWFEIDKNVDLKKIYKIEFSQSACSTSTIILLNDKEIGKMNYGDCESLYDDDTKVIDYQNKKFTYDISDLRDNLITNYKNKFEFRNERTQVSEFVVKGNKVISEEAFNQEIKIIEKAQCTSSSQCILITINDEEKQPYCSLKHKCSLDLS